MRCNSAWSIPKLQSFRSDTILLKLSPWQLNASFDKPINFDTSIVGLIWFNCSLTNLEIFWPNCATITLNVFKQYNSITMVESKRVLSAIKSEVNRTVFTITLWLVTASNHLSEQKLCTMFYRNVVEWHRTYHKRFAISLVQHSTILCTINLHVLQEFYKSQSMEREH